jgi:hypothetical protein
VKGSKAVKHAPALHGDGWRPQIVKVLSLSSLLSMVVLQVQGM